jgi:predicted HD phosphohydrolase
MLVHVMSIASTAVRAGQKETSIVTSQLIKDVGVAQEKFNSSMEMSVKQTLVAQTAQSAERAGP